MAKPPTKNPNRASVEPDGQVGVADTEPCLIATGV
jgi:hypothetical protein